MDYAFIPHPQYWVAFSNYTEGEVIDINAVSQTAQIVFPLNVYSLSINFQEDNTWSTPVSLKQKNTRLIEQMQKRSIY